MIEIEITIPTARLELQDDHIYDYLEKMNMQYEFIPNSDFDFILTKKQIAELLDYILQDNERDINMVEVLCMTLTEMVQQKQKVAEFRIKKEAKNESQT